MVKVALKIKEKSMMVLIVEIIQSGMRLNQDTIGKIMLRQVVKDLRNSSLMRDTMRVLPS